MPFVDPSRPDPVKSLTQPRWGLRTTLFTGAAGLSLLVFGCSPAFGAESGLSWGDIGDILLLKNYNTRLVVLSTSALGIAAGIVGAFLLLRKRSLMGDALAHSTLPGIVIAFVVMLALGGTGKSLP